MASRNKISKNKTVSKVFKLSDICLDSIRQNFNKFVNAHENSHSEEIKGNLVFLQMKFSSYFLDSFTNKKTVYLKNSLFHLLLNEHLNELNTVIFQEDDWEDALHYLKEIGQTFEKVTFRYKYPSVAEDGEPHRKRLKSLSEGVLQNFVHVLLPKLTKVSSLTMHASTRFTNETLKMIHATCKDLKVLTFGGQRSITEEGLKYLCPDDSCNKLNLKSLNFPSEDDIPYLPTISENGIAHLLLNIESLETISYFRLPRVLHKMHLGDLLKNTLSNVRKYNLTSMEINIYDNFFDHPGGCDTKALEQTLDIVVELCPALKTLSLVGVAENKHLLALTKFPDLVDVSITGDPRRGIVDPDEVLRLSGKQLKVLSLMHMHVSVASLLMSCPRLDSLSLSFIYYTDFPEQLDLKPQCSLKNLNFQGFDASKANAEKSLQLLLECCPNLEKLLFFCCTLDQEVKGIIGRFCVQTECLQRLTFHGCPKLDPGLLQRIVASCRSLKTLIVIRCPTIGLSEIEALRDIVKASGTSEPRIEFTCQKKHGDSVSHAGDVISYGEVSNRADSDDGLDDESGGDYDSGDDS